MAWSDVFFRPRLTMHRTAGPVAMLLAFLLAGCSVSGPRESPINAVTKGSPTVVQIYRGQGATAVGVGGAEGADGTAVDKTARDRLLERSAARPVRDGDADTSDTQRYWSALEPMRNRFARVPNPDLVMVVFPHLSRGKYPVPGYVTVFPMYEQADLYALPGELEGELVRRQPPAPTTAGAAR